MTEEQKRKISIALSGRKLSEAHKENLRASHSGKTLTLEHRRKLREAHTGVPLSDAHRASLSAARAGVKRPLSKELRTAVSESNRRRTGAAHPRWVPDRSKLARKSQNRTTADVTWSNHVRRRFPKCVLHGSSYGGCSGRLESHHIEPISKNPGLRFVVGNGVTLCRGHHPLKEDDVEKLKPVLTALTVRTN